MYPSIALHTRLTDNTATLVDNIFPNYLNTNAQSSEILISDMSDVLGTLLCSVRETLKN